MKYMGSKRWMLGNGLGHLLDQVAPECERFVDLFAGSAAVTTFVATRHEVPVHCCDLQTYSKYLASAIIERTKPLPDEPAWSEWKRQATQVWRTSQSSPTVDRLTKQCVQDARTWCAARRTWPLTRAYGGHYFSPKQGIWLDSFRKTIPTAPAYRKVALAALINAAAYCAAAPGHTAQPFQPTRTAKPFLKDYWSREVPRYVERIFKSLCAQHAKKAGVAMVGDANDVAKELRAGDLVFIDPPYSAVHYSRFYHVLESVATGYDDAVTGSGRYPREGVRPKSAFSTVSGSGNALDVLLAAIADKRADAIVTFPNHQCSNGLSGQSVSDIARKYFHVERRVVSSRFSSLGGTSGASSVGSERAARLSAIELILQLRATRPSRRSQRTAKQ